MPLILAQSVMSFVFSVVSPYLPLLVRNLGYTAATVGIILAVFEGAGILGPFVIGRAADKYGKYKSCIILSFVLIALPAIPLARYANPLLSALFVAVIAAGFRSAVALVEAITSINVGKGGNYGKIRVTGSAAFVVFALFLQLIPVLRPDTADNIALWTCFTSVFAMLVMFFLPLRSSPPNPAQPHPAAGAVSDSNTDTNNAAGGTATQTSIWTPIFILSLICIALNRIAMTPIYTFLSLFVVEYIKWDAVGLVWALACMAEIPFLYISHRVIRRFGALPVLAFTSVILVLRLLLYAIFPVRAGVVIAQLLHSFCFGLFHPAAVAFISGCVPAKQRSYGMSLYLSLGQGLPLFVGNFIGGFLVDHSGYRFMFGFFAVFPLLAAVIQYAGYRKYTRKTIIQNSTT